MPIYNSIRSFMRPISPILYSGLAAIALTGCSDTRPMRERAGEDVKAEESYFTEWGFLKTINNGDYDVKLGDMDGDGDLDIVVGSYRGLTIYENRIPQKKDISKNK